MEWLLANWFIIVIPLLILSLPIYFIVSTVNLKKDEKKRLEQLEMECKENPDGPSLEETHGRVMEKHCYSGVGGGKVGKAYTCFYFLFLTDDGDTRRYETDEETYLAIKENTEGTVAVVGDLFYGFCPDEKED